MACRDSKLLPEPMMTQWWPSADNKVDKLIVFSHFDYIFTDQTNYYSSHFMLKILKMKTMMTLHTILNDGG